MHVKGNVLQMTKVEEAELTSPNLGKQFDIQEFR